MPARETVAPWRRPAHNMLWFGFFPECKILRILLITLCSKFAGVSNHIFNISSTKLAVMVGFIEFFHVKIYRTVYLVGKTFFDDCFNDFNLFNNMAGGRRFYTRWQVIEFLQNIMKIYGVALNHFHRFYLF